MVTNRMTEGVGKKIVEALKHQSDIEINTISTGEALEYSAPDDVGGVIEPQIIQHQENILDDEQNGNELEIVNNQEDSQQASFNFSDSNYVNETFNSALMNSSLHDSTSKVEELKLPANVAVLKQLINKLPSGVSKQTGAQIIRQTMEALGIPMTGVLQEAQQVQENLNQSVRDCQTSILEHKKQITILESQSQKYQKQFATVNDIISLFIQTGI